MAESAGYKRILVSDNEAHFQWPFWMNGIPHKSLLRIKVLIIDTSVGVILGWVKDRMVLVQNVLLLR